MTAGRAIRFPVQRAIEFGATHIVVVRTRPAGYVKKPALPWRATTPLQNRYNESVRLIAHPPAGQSIVSFNPTTMFVGRLTRNQRRITAAIDHGKDVANQVIDAHPAFFDTLARRGYPPERAR